jgi:hypothetical protein
LEGGTRVCLRRDTWVPPYMMRLEIIPH